MTLRIAIQHRFPGAEIAVDFSVPPGVTALFGPSGAGKSSVLMAIAGLLRPDRATITLDGAALPRAPHRRRVAVVFQEARLFPHMSVRQNLGFGLRWAPQGGPALGEVAGLLGLTALLDRHPATLSGGEAQRVAIGRALLSHPQVLLMDEPLSALDAPRKAEILPWLEALAARTRIPLLYVSHALPEIARLAARMVVIDRGRIRAEGRLEEILSDPDLAPLIGLTEMGAVIEAEVAETAPDGLARLITPGGPLFLAVQAAPGARLRLRLAAQDIILSHARPEGLSALNILTARILRLNSGEGSVLVQLGMGESRFLARVTQRSAQAMDLRPGQEVHAILKTVALAGAL
ncbi:molybdenum ABC transporter ATP-binding protein [Stagnihabitans tardus]|uniref:Molybdenum ABC transporter ATP-binding protein n=1 Tax=Stagnihabitans tardus TaxID=2699202 RepID=A0AAE4YA56_9RHOB|nr:molybdenum ABC transporter ATP-binding protein [Stagnihabitans tardus]NBZ87932.1 molybdenum ABC transporter ATP-binding protein [Stagnihabitans tardus]